jgi:hypothetical protein
MTQYQRVWKVKLRCNYGSFYSSYIVCSFLMGLISLTQMFSNEIQITSENRTIVGYIWSGKLYNARNVGLRLGKTWTSLVKSKWWIATEFIAVLTARWTIFQLHRLDSCVDGGYLVKDCWLYLFCCRVIECSFVWRWFPVIRYFSPGNHHQHNCPQRCSWIIVQRAAITSRESCYLFVSYLSQLYHVTKFTFR